MNQIQFKEELAEHPIPYLLSILLPAYLVDKSISKAMMMQVCNSLGRQPSIPQKEEMAKVYISKLKGQSLTDQLLQEMVEESEMLEAND